MMASLRTLFGKAASSKSGAPIGVDFAAQRLNMLQIEDDGAQANAAPLVRAAVSVPYPLERAQLLADPRALKSLVREALAGGDFAGRRVVAALPPSEVRILPLTVHVAAGQNEQQAVARVVRDQLGAAALESVVDYYQVRSADASSSERQVLAAVASNAHVHAYLDALRGAGLEPVALDIGPAAIARLLAAMQEDYEQSVLLVNFGASKSFLTVIWGRRLMLDREVDFGETQLVDKLARALGLSPEVALTLLHEHGVGSAERVPQPGAGPQTDIGRTIREILYQEFAALAEELVRTQVYVASRTRGSALSRVYLNGSVARYPHIRPRMEELVRLPVEILDPFRAFRAAPAFTPTFTVAQGIALAAGLALRGRSHG
ncbi:pilus assembly protein PilM [Massilia aerilata]|uniref:Pilus assembly protein PilM n=1 Tax=Massilia aerilata TaxID=453817 RepID=A0ABW0S7A6_9BURK